jgi:hypothetical protein
MREAPDHTVLIASLALIAAIIAALIAAISADIRQRRQLKHDRHMQDLAELRSVLDDATVALQEAIHTLQNVFARFGAPQDAAASAGSVTPKPGDGAPTEKQAAKAHDAEVAAEAQRIWERMDKEQYNSDMQKCGDSRDDMITVGQRIAIRIGDAQPLSITYEGAVSLVIASIREIGAKKRQEENGAQVSAQGFEELNKKLGAARQLFVEQAVAQVGSQLP